MYLLKKEMLTKNIGQSLGQDIEMLNERPFETILGNWKHFKNDEKCFLFHLKSSFCSEDIYVLVLTKT